MKWFWTRKIFAKDSLLEVYYNFIIFFYQKGYGVFALKNFPKGSFLCEYIGECLTKKDGYKREVEYENDNEENGSFLFFYGDLW